MKTLKVAILSMMFAAIAYAAAQAIGSVDRVNSPKAQHFISGTYLGNDTKNPLSNTLNKQSYHLCGTMVHDFASIPATGANSGCQSSVSDLTITGCGFGDRLSMGIDQIPPTLMNGTIPQPFVTAASTLKVQICNNSSDGGAVDFPDASFTICCDG